jgi:dihydroorotase
LRGIIDKDARANVFICAAITKGRKGDELTDFSALKKEGAVALSDDGASVDDDAVMQEGFARAKNNKLTVICHSEDRRLSNNGLVNAGFTATRLGLRGISRESEYKRVSRDLTLAQKADAQVHITHLSCKESLELVAKAKKQGLRVSCDVTPHHLSLSEEAVLGYDTNFKMNPPLRAEGDIQAVKEGLARGVIDAIASDHAPHTENEKEIEFERAEFGVIGLETELAVSATELISRDILDWPGLVRKISFNPAQILGLDRGTLGVGRQADIVVFDPDKKWLVEKRGFLSKSTNSCFIGRRLKGIVKYTLYAGQVVYLHK